MPNRCQRAIHWVEAIRYHTKMKNVTRRKCENLTETLTSDEVTVAITLPETSEPTDGGSSEGLLGAFRSGIEQSLLLVQQMSREERAIAYSTLSSLCGDTNPLMSKLFQSEATSETHKFKSQEEHHVEIEIVNSGDSTLVLGANCESTTVQDSELTKKKVVSKRGKSQRLIAKRRSQGENTTKHRVQNQIVKVAKARRALRKKSSKHTNGEEPASGGDESDNGWQHAHNTAIVSEAVSDKNKVSSDDGKFFQCETCKRDLKSRFSLLVHQRTHTGEKPYSCHLCNKSFSCATNCKRHVRETHEGVRPFNCTQCSMGFFRQINLEMHLEEDHGLTAQELKDERTKKVSKPEFQIYTCKDCSKIFKTKSHLRVHEAVHKEEREHACPHCEKKFSFRNNLIRHLMIHTGVRPHQCSTCSMGFIEAKSLKLHIRREHGQSDDLVEPEKLTCEICGRQLASKATLQNHMLTHTGSKPHMCTHCNKAFSMKSNLKRHLRSHSNEKPWECPTCSKRFTEKKSMEVHFRVHSGEKPYTCKECGKSFAQASTLQGHMPVHNKERAVSCEICGKSFLRMSHYHFHVAKHNSAPKHKCSDCPRAFYRKADLDRHRLTHTGERPYHCSMCPKQFSRPLYLKDHLNLHLGQRPYTCNHCPITYAESSARNKHMRRCPMRVTSKPVLINEAAVSVHDVNQDVTMPMQLDIVTTAMSTAALSSLTMMSGGELVAEEPNVMMEPPNDQHQVTAAMENLMALANGGMLTLQSGTALDMADLTAVPEVPNKDEVPGWQQIGVHAIDVNSVKEVHIQDIDTEVGKTKHYIVVLQAPPEDIVETQTN